MMRGLALFGVLSSLGTSVARAEAPDLPMQPMLAPSTAGAAAPGTHQAGGGLAVGWTGALRSGMVVGGRWWPVKRLLVAGDVQTGVADLSCVSCTGALGRVSVRANALEWDALRFGVVGQASGTMGLGPTGALASSLVLETGTSWLRFDAAAQLWSTVDVLEDARSGWETGLSVHSTPHHATRVGTVGPHFRPTVGHRYLRGGSWMSGELVWAEEGPVLRAQVGRVF